MYTTIRHELRQVRKAWPGTLVDPCLLSWLCPLPNVFPLRPCMVSEYVWLLRCVCNGQVWMLSIEKCVLVMEERKVVLDWDTNDHFLALSICISWWKVEREDGRGRCICVKVGIHFTQSCIGDSIETGLQVYILYVPFILLGWRLLLISYKSEHI